MSVWRKVLLGVIAFILAAGYVVFGAMSTHREERNGWRLRSYCSPFVCSHCLGRVEELTWQGLPIVPPQWVPRSIDEQTPLMHMVTPVGRFRCDGANQPWRPNSWSIIWNEESRELTPIERAQGWCDAVPSDKSDFHHGSGPYVRPAGVPDDWCLLVTTGGTGRWVRADVISRLKW